MAWLVKNNFKYYKNSLFHDDGNRNLSCWRKITFSHEHIFFNKSKVKLLQIKQGTITRKCYQKHEKRV